jgi:transposase
VKRISQSMISAVSNRGLMRFMLYDGALNVDRFIAFLRRLTRDAGQKVFLVVDNLKVHHALKVKAWVASHRHEIELFHLPAYAPDHNPDEYLNNDLKQKLRQQPQPAGKDELIKGTRSVLRAIQRSPQRIRAYFTPAPVRYAA